jgi:quercetin dioxygenase-like cupin family protein
VQLARELLQLVDPLGDLDLHFGYVLGGAATVRYTDGETETLSTGQAYYLRPGHNVRIDQDAEFVEFTHADQAPGINTLDL